ncbi:MAG: hypothetical protein G3M70_02150 [Candidatus Nitronauta litoralis]|uniref:Uncharacterized protein n=1 Tax=Candidatus Nitronauta litoralis TaxID=2705533 RepID=A0A7T0FZD7_9BACT|nr:MAG: hypothetical protein G3M70_02150 [Candidatus Nitronauta litoralis]
MVDQSNTVKTFRLFSWLALILVLLLLITSSAQAQGNMMEVPAPRTLGKFNLLQGSPPIWVKLQGWYCLNESLATFIGQELDSYITGMGGKKDLKFERATAKVAFENLEGDYALKNFEHAKDPKYGQFNPSPGMTIYKSVKHCYTRDQLVKWNELIKRLAQQMVNSPDPVKEAKRLLPNFSNGK